MPTANIHERLMATTNSQVTKRARTADIYES